MNHRRYTPRWARRPKGLQATKNQQLLTLTCQAVTDLGRVSIRLESKLDDTLELLAVFSEEERIGKVAALRKKHKNRDLLLAMRKANQEEA